jgi:acyl-coenzyme A synthetase/AMP-(fatty) acid ligase/3-hydroxymyristoyl/3-hydroxydecanoyl-(acyl carrier protein) dehydratase
MIDPVPLESLLMHAGDRTVGLRAGRAVDAVAFEHAAAAWCAAFAAMPGKNWAVFFEDSVEFAAALFGAWHAGKCVYLPSDALPGTVERLSREVDGFVGGFPNTTTLCKLVPQADRHWTALDRNADALVVYTSGSSGEPVSIPKKLGQLFAEIDTQLGLWEEMFEGAVVHATVSHQHIYGLLFRVLLPLAAGRPFAAERLLYPEDMIAALYACAGTVLIVSPAHLKRLPETLPWESVRVGLRGIFSSGGPLPDEALSDCRGCFGQVPVEVYGSSETGGVAWRRRESTDVRRWKLLPGVEMRPMQDEVQVRSPHLPNGDWFTLSDRVSLCEREGEFELLGRADRIVKIEEKRVSLSAVEQALKCCDLVVDARVMPLSGERVVLGAVVVPSEKGWALYRAEGKRALNARLRVWLAREIEASVLPRRWRFSWAMPVNAQGKTTEQMLAALFDSRRPPVCLLTRSEREATLRIDIEADSPFFDGHFPQSPILPGVTQIEWAIVFGRELFPLPPVFLRMDSIKFQQVIQPGSVVSLALEFSPERGSLSFKFTSDAGTHAGGRISFGEKA